MDFSKPQFINELAVSEKNIAMQKKFLFFKWTSHKTVFQLVHPLVYWSPLLNGFVIVPKNFWTDYASHPIKFLGFSPPYETNRPATCHDELYSLRFFFPITNSKYKFYIPPKNELWRDMFDNVLREALIAAGLEKFRAKLWFFAVRAGGEGPWMSVEESPDLTFEIDYLKTLGLPKEILDAVEKAESSLAQFN